MSKNVAILGLVAAFSMLCVLSGCSRPVGGVSMQAGLEYSPEDGSVRAVTVQNPSTHAIESATVQMDFHLGNGDVLTKKQKVDRIEKKSSWRYQLDDSIQNVVSVDIMISGADGRGKMTLQVPSNDGAKVSNSGVRSSDTTGYAQNPEAKDKRGDCQLFAQLIGEWSGFKAGYLTIKASKEFEWGIGRSSVKGTCTFIDSHLRLFPSEIKEEGKETEKLPAKSAKFLEYEVTSMNPLTIKGEGLVEKYRSVSGGDKKRGNVGIEISAAPTGEPSVHVSRTYIIRLREGWREIYIDHEFKEGSLIESVRNGQTYTLVMKTDSGQTQRMPARITSAEFYVVCFPDSVESWNEGQAERFWQSIKSATFWIEYQPTKDDKGFRVSPVVKISQPDF